MQGKTITIFCAFTREWAVNKFIADLKHAMRNQDRKMINLAFIVDFDSLEICLKLRKMAVEDHYGSIEIEMNHEHNPNEVSIYTRRKRIAEIKNQSKLLIARHHSDFVLSLEDDSGFAELDSFERLLSKLLDNKLSIGLVSGVECGRWNWKYVGAWRFDEPKQPTIAWTVLPETDGYQQVHATGFYCYITPTNLYMEHEYYWEENQPWGPDVNYGLWLQQKDMFCFIDWQTAIDHNSYNSTVKVFDDLPLKSVCYTINEDQLTWRRQDEKSRATN